MTFIIVCAGTAGHINPGLSIAQELCARLPEAKILFIGAGRDMEKKLIPEAGFELVNIKMSGIKRGLGPRDIIHNARTLKNLALAGRSAAKILKKMMPDAVIGTGGYICYPVLRAAAKRKIPTFIHESNAQPGMTVKMLSAIADKVMITYPGFESHYKRPERVVLTGTPVRRELAEYAGAEKTRKKAEKPLVVSFWGSLGAQRMNEIMAGFIEKNLADKSFYHIHATGSSKTSLTNKLNELGVAEVVPPYADIRDYIDDMPAVMNSADLVLCRAGATTLAELTVSGKPGVLIPSPYVPDNVQLKNAEQLQKAGAAVLLTEAECNADMLYETVCSLIRNPGRLSGMAQAAKTLAAPSARADIAELILSQIRKPRAGS